MQKKRTLNRDVIIVFYLLDLATPFWVKDKEQDSEYVPHHLTPNFNFKIMYNRFAAHIYDLPE